MITKISRLLLLMVLAISCTDNSTTKVSTPSKESNVADQTSYSKNSQDNKLDSPSLIHTVYVWLREDLTEEEIREFERDARNLSTISSVARFRMGKPAQTADRPVVDHSYSYAMNIEFISIADQDHYQDDPIHLSFIERNKDKWTKVVVYDNNVQ